MLKREALAQRLLDALASSPEIYAIYTFGAQVTGRIDAYSDIDLVICSDAPEKTRGEYRQIFSSISPIRAELVLANRADVYTAMTLLHAASPYQKIDFSIVADIETQRRFSPFELLYEKRQRVDGKKSMRVLPDTDDLQNQLNDVLFSIPRFSKCLFRDDFYQYQRWQGVLNRALTLLYEKHFQTSANKLNSRQYQELYAALSSADRARLEAIMPLHTPLQLGDSFVECIDFVAALYRQKAAQSGQRLDEEFAHYMQSFLAAEIRRSN